MNDGSAGEIDRGNFCGGIPHAIHPAVNSPDHVGDWKIDEEHPDAYEDKNRSELHPLRHRAND